MRSCLTLVWVSARAQTSEISAQRHKLSRKPPRKNLVYSVQAAVPFVTSEHRSQGTVGAPGCAWEVLDGGAGINIETNWGVMFVKGTGGSCGLRQSSKKIKAEVEQVTVLWQGFIPLWRCWSCLSVPVSNCSTDSAWMRSEWRWQWPAGAELCQHPKVTLRESLFHGLLSFH